MSGGPLCQTQVERFAQDGFLVVADLLSPDELAAFAAHERATAAAPRNLQHHRIDPQWAHLAKHPGIVPIVRQLLGGRPQIAQTMYLAKAPQGGTGIALHQDSMYIRNTPNTLMACWLALSDTDRANGGLCVVPGSNREGLHPAHKARDTRQHASWETDYEMRAPDGREWKERLVSFEISDLDPSRVEYLRVPAGSGVFFTGMTIHGSYANPSADRPRLAFATHYVREGTWIDRRDLQDLVDAE
ncbi:MAG: phytanoyl-CoA dioxygenase family protein [Candidatus Latescibacteria bacterium]|nr:phytanoyl-CoA dioxygenase family protein [Candidatus Latescibacterota bacterium]